MSEKKSIKQSILSDMLPDLLGVIGIYAAQPAADILTVLVCALSIPAMKRIASENMMKREEK